jgi:hypothetical protein
MWSTTAYTQFATWATVDYLARDAVMRVCEAGEAHIRALAASMYDVIAV